jgi:hypothetical protein
VWVSWESQNVGEALIAVTVTAHSGSALSKLHRCPHLAFER